MTRSTQHRSDQFRLRSVPRFSDAQCDTLFAKVLVNDVVTQGAALPPAVHFAYTQVQLDECYYLGRQVWKDGVNRGSFAALVTAIFCDRVPDAGCQVLFKHVRARFKLLRFAYAVFGSTKRYPPVLDAATKLMGAVQDNFRNERPIATAWNALLLRLLLTRLPYNRMQREVANFQVSTVTEFQNYQLSEIGAIRKSLEKSRFTGKDVHDLRKIISRQVAIFSCLSTLYPSNYHEQVLRYLSSLNGYMGSFHDTLVKRRFLDPVSYCTHEFALPAKIEAGLCAVARSYPDRPRLVGDTGSHGKLGQLQGT